MCVASLIVQYFYIFCSQTERVIAVYFSDEERSEYEEMETKACRFYADFKKTRGHEITKHYLRLLQKLTPMRIACSGGHVPLEDEAAVDLATGEDPLDTTDENLDGKTKKSRKHVKFSDFAFSSKFHALLRELKRIRETDPSGKQLLIVAFHGASCPDSLNVFSFLIQTGKSLVFSQYTTTLNYLQIELSKNNFQFRTLSGDMTMKQRAKALLDFQNDPPTTVFLLSMR